jgi:DNA repair protein RecO (recombination protein O)
MGDETAAPAILLRRRPYGDADLIVTLLTEDRGKRTLLARSARRSVRRFAGCLDPFSLLHIVAAPGKGGLDELREASLDRVFPALRSDPHRMAVAGCWSELVDGWLEPAVPQGSMFALLRTALSHLDGDRTPSERVHLIFQLRFLELAGLSPDLSRCGRCRRPLEEGPVFPDVASGGFRCGSCGNGRREPPLPAGLLRKLRRIARRGQSDSPPADGDAGGNDPAPRPDARSRSGPIQSGQTRSGPCGSGPSQSGPNPSGPNGAGRGRSDSPAAGTGLDAAAARLLEQFVSHHLGRTPRSLAFLRDLRRAAEQPPPVSPERRVSHAGPSA